MATLLQGDPSGFGLHEMKLGGTVTAGMMVVVGEDGCAAAADSCTTGIIGVSTVGGVDGGTDVIANQGVVAMTCAASAQPTDIGDYCYVASSTTVNTGSTGDMPCGMVVGTTAPAASGTISMLLICAQSIGYATVKA